jgi:hypothetical protein
MVAVLVIPGKLEGRWLRQRRTPLRLGQHPDHSCRLLLVRPGGTPIDAWRFRKLRAELTAWIETRSRK